ncbi:hypothetical protein [Marinoscillum furvescens]|uniref:Uncharacterized protein n=1 Tax=Marinoscillum furvescens DSM 4134 TaxID=1122208 RepID=A0A3D9L619_MARFU|nr:hypothetical protein [Marinoscillum furvescens]RED99872.1 hypothetical protein C7460_107156 [Marinoscillum furvescens DSM 4134]
MKVILTSILTLVLFNLANAQIGISLEDAKTRGIEVAQLDSTYRSGIHSDASKAVFGDQQNAYIKAYYSMIHDLSAFLNGRDFRWGSQTRCFNRIYFSADGSIDYFIYEFSEGELNSDRKETFERLLNEFIVDYKFSLTSNVPFAQCSPVNYRDTL